MRIQILHVLSVNHAHDGHHRADGAGAEKQVQEHLEYDDYGDLGSAGLLRAHCD